ncbi:membrane protein insertion efficiency factor YidD [Candidatus Aquiluna sp. UB-MaderosW2red]|uniref:membrane protein insertion efficiency factor YidD n=1 Tax=Candidatus Aquiluna sp. UB-MaderosW2red TaxID=1855377 RepID=UPI000875DEB8|nr:membrane protein insertion efficiency factor YidD [Candidatus Aquiluna sp. UB-MaderosW2red]SCX04526.1 hypothetical protein SAMN05216534_0268 [Candidatus Aquiluna sp. UB-MaderosW2red]
MKYAGFIWFLPRNLLAALIGMYRKFISPLYGDVCRYYPSCSGYGLHSVQQKGAVIGTLLTIWRVMRCNPWSAGGVDEVKPGPNYLLVSKLGFVSLNMQERSR